MMGESNSNEEALPGWKKGKSDITSQILDVHRVLMHTYTDPQIVLHN